MGPLILALHGLGGTGAVWQRFSAVAAGVGVRVVAPDLAGHGRTAPRLARYSPAALADELVTRLAGPVFDAPVVIVGHSLGGAVGLEVAGRHRDLPVRAVAAVGVKTVWTDDELAGMARLAAKGPAWFDDERSALDRHRRVTGLEGLVDDEQARAGVDAVDGRWRLALDPAVYGVGGVDMAALVAAAPCPVLLVRGELDAMVAEPDLSAHGPVHTIAGAGHNVHAEDPDALWALVTPLLD